MPLLPSPAVVSRGHVHGDAREGHDDREGEIERDGDAHFDSADATARDEERGRGAHRLVHLGAVLRCRRNGT